LYDRHSMFRSEVAVLRKEIARFQGGKGKGRISKKANKENNDKGIERTLTPGQQVKYDALIDKLRAFFDANSIKALYRLVDIPATIMATAYDFLRRCTFARLRSYEAFLHLEFFFVLLASFIFNRQSVFPTELAELLGIDPMSLAGGPVRTTKKYWEHIKFVCFNGVTNLDQILFDRGQPIRWMLDASLRRLLTLIWPIKWQDDTYQRLTLLMQILSLNNWALLKISVFMRHSHRQDEYLETRARQRLEEFHLSTSANANQVSNVSSTTNASSVRMNRCDDEGTATTHTTVLLASNTSSAQTSTADIPSPASAARTGRRRKGDDDSVEESQQHCFFEARYWTQLPVFILHEAIRCRCYSPAVPAGTDPKWLQHKLDQLGMQELVGHNLDKIGRSYYDYFPELSRRMKIVCAILGRIAGDPTMDDTRQAIQAALAPSAENLPMDDIRFSYYKRVSTEANEHRWQNARPQPTPDLAPHGLWLAAIGRGDRYSLQATARAPYRMSTNMFPLLTTSGSIPLILPPRDIAAPNMKRVKCSAHNVKVVGEAMHMTNQNKQSLVIDEKSNPTSIIAINTSAELRNASVPSSSVVNKSMYVSSVTQCDPLQHNQRKSQHSLINCSICECVSSSACACTKMITRYVSPSTLSNQHVHSMNGCAALIQAVEIAKPTTIIQKSDQLTPLLTIDGNGLHLPGMDTVQPASYTGIDCLYNHLMIRAKYAATIFKRVTCIAHNAKVVHETINTTTQSKQVLDIHDGSNPTSKIAISTSAELQNAWAPNSSVVNKPMCISTVPQKSPLQHNATIPQLSRENSSICECVTSSACACIQMVTRVTKPSTISNQCGQLINGCVAPMQQLHIANAKTQESYQLLPLLTRDATAFGLPARDALRSASYTGIDYLYNHLMIRAKHACVNTTR
jgi:hypothetical protein